MRIVVIALLCVILLNLLAQEAFPRQRALTTKEKTLLRKAQTVYVQTVALTEKGLTKPDAIREVVARRFQEIGFSTAKTSQDPHDVVVKVKCEERKTWLGVTKRGGDADLPHAPSRVWKGPACQITYRLNGQDSGWRKEVRTDFDNAMRAAQDAKVEDSGKYALIELTKKLKHDDFPLLLTAEWRQAERLISLMKKPETDHHLKTKIIPLLGMFSEPSVLPPLKEALTDPALAPQAAMALGHVGNHSTDTLLHLLENAKTPALKVAAVKGLGEIATHDADETIMNALLTTLHKPDIELTVQTEIVKALGKLSDQRAIPSLEELNRKAWTDPSKDPEMQELREALSWSLWQLNPDAHTAE